MERSQAIIIYGGSFNPVHIGHMRLAIEALGFPDGMASRVVFVPSAVPPHKKCSAMLPFGLRVELLRAAIGNIPGLSCSEIEASLPAPSYTYETLKFLANEHGKDNLYFLIGSGDFRLLPEWHYGLSLPEVCNLVVAPRGDYSESEFARQARIFWPEAAKARPGPVEGCTGGQTWAVNLPQGSRAYLLPLPYLEISATRIRRLWLCGKNLDYLVPKAALEILMRERQAVRSCWQEKKCSR